MADKHSVDSNIYSLCFYIQVITALMLIVDVILTIVLFIRQRRLKKLKSYVEAQGEKKQKYIEIVEETKKRHIKIGIITLIIFLIAYLTTNFVYKDNSRVCL